MPDARGHGNSDSPLHGYRYDEHAADLLALIERLQLATPVVLGHSMGGMTAALAASRSADIRAVVLVDPTFISERWQREVRDSDVVEQHRRLLDLGPDDVISELAVRHPHRSREIIELLAQARLQTRLSAFDVLTPPNPDYRELIREIRVPMLLVTSDGGVVSQDRARELQQLNPSLRTAHVTGAGHGIPYDRPDRLEAAVAAFLADSG